MKRRDFVGTIGAVAAGTSVLPSLARAIEFLPSNAGAASLKRIGLETYSVRDRMKIDPDGTLRAVLQAHAEARFVHSEIPAEFFDSVCVFEEAGPGADFRLVERIRFGV